MTQKNRFADEGYNISIVGKNVQITDAMRNYIMEKLSKVERITPHIIDLIVALDIQKLAHTVSMVIKFSNVHVKVHATMDDMYSAIDKASDKLIKLIHKYKEKLQSHRFQHLSSVDMKVSVLSYPKDEIEEINQEIEAENLKREAEIYRTPKIVNEEKMSLKTLTKEEAVMKLELTAKPFILYKSEEDHKLRLIYRREDDKFAIVEVE